APTLEAEEAPSAPRSVRSRKRPATFIGVAAVSGIAAVVVLLVVLMRGGGRTTTAATSPGPVATVVPPIDHLEPRGIAADEGFPWQKDVVAVLGKHRRRHWGSVTCLALSADGKHIATGGTDRHVRLWNAETLREEATYKVEPAAPDTRLANLEVRSVVFT